MNQIETLVARAEIEDCLKRYARGVDRKDWEGVKACFYPDASDHHGDFLGNREQFVEWVDARHKNVPFSMHYLLNCLIEFSCDTEAHVETYFCAIQRREVPGQDPIDHTVFGRYVDVFEKRDGGWRISNRQVVYDSTSTEPSTNHLRKLVGVLGRRDKTDPVFQVPVAAE